MRKFSIIIIISRLLCVLNKQKLINSELYWDKKKNGLIKKKIC